MNASQTCHNVSRLGVGYSPESTNPEEQDSVILGTVPLGDTIIGRPVRSQASPKKRCEASHVSGDTPHVILGTVPFGRADS